MYQNSQTLYGVKILQSEFCTFQATEWSEKYFEFLSFNYSTAIIVVAFNCWRS